MKTGEIRTNPLQPRKSFDPEALEALAASIKAIGVLQPLLVRAEGDDFVLVAGERRWRAARLAEVDTVPVLVDEVDQRASLERALVENLHRVDLGPMEEAAAYQQLIEDFGISHDEVAARVGKSRAAITNALRLFQLPARVQRFLADGVLSAGHGRALLTLDDVRLQEVLAERIVSEGLSVRQTEDMARELQKRSPKAPERPQLKKGRGRPQDPAYLEVESLLMEALDTTVEVRGNNRRGRLVIHFADREDLARIYAKLSGAGEGELGTETPSTAGKL